MKKIVLGLISFVLYPFIIVSVVSGQYFYLTGNGSENNGFQQGCSEQYYVKYNLPSLYNNVKALYLHVKLGKILLDYGPQYPFTLDTNATNFVSQQSNYEDAGSHEIIFYGAKNNGDNDVLPVGNNKTLGSFSFTPKYSGNNYTGFLIIKYEYGKDEQESSKIIFGSKNAIDDASGTQNLNLTGSFLVKREPCKVDTKKPTITSNTYTNNSTGVSNVGLSFIIDDETKNGETPYYYSGGVWTGNGGENKIGKWTINDQTGVDFSTVVVKVQGNGTGKTFTGNVNLNGTPLGQTWGGTDRGYNVNISSSQLFDFGIEEQINITIDGKDRNGSGADTYTRVFNIPTPPTIENLYPANGAETVQINSEIRFSGRDDWAGVSGDYVNITIECLSGCYDRNNTKIYTKSFFDENEDSSITLVGTDGLGNAGGYDYILKPDVDLPAESNMKITVDIYDLKGNPISSDSNSWTFDTRPLCSKLQCCSTTTIMTGGEIGIEFTGSVLTITGGNSIIAGIETGYEYSETLSGDLFVINCNYVGTTLFKGNPEDLDAVNLGVYTDEIIFSGDDTIYGVLSGNVLTFYKVPLGSVEFSNLRPNEGAPKSNFDFEWDASIGERTNFSGFRVELYSGDSCEGSPIWSGYASGTGARSLTYDSDDLVSLQHYCWKVSAMARNTVISSGTATFTGMMEVELIADLGRGNTRNSTTGKWLLYYMDDLNNSLYSGYITSITSNEREGNITGYNLVLYSGIKNGNECQGEKLISGLFNGMGFVENVYAGNYCWEIYPVYLDNTTGAIQSQEFSILSYMFIRSEQLDSGFALAYHAKYNPIYSGYVHLGSGTNESPYGTGKIIGLFDSGYYYFVYKDWQHLTVYTGVQLYGSADKIVIDLRYAPGTYSSGQLMVGDTPSRNGDGDWTHDFNINAMDISFVGGSECLSREDKTTWLAICDVNGDGDLQVGDITAYSTFLPYYDVVYSNGLFGGFGLVDYGLSELSE